jgi:hypothetical protein
MGSIEARDQTEATPTVSVANVASIRISIRAVLIASDPTHKFTLDKLPQQVVSIWDMG